MHSLALAESAARVCCGKTFLTLPKPAASESKRPAAPREISELQRQHDRAAARLCVLQPPLLPPRSRLETSTGYPPASEPCEGCSRVLSVSKRRNRDRSRCNNLRS